MPRVNKKNILFFLSKIWKNIEDSHIISLIKDCIEKEKEEMNYIWKLESWFLDIYILDNILNIYESIPNMYNKRKNIYIIKLYFFKKEFIVHRYFHLFSEEFKFLNKINTLKYKMYSFFWKEKYYLKKFKKKFKKRKIDHYKYSLEYLDRFINNYKDSLDNPILLDIYSSFIKRDLLIYKRYYKVLCE